MAQQRGRNTAEWKRLVRWCKAHLPWVCHLCGLPIDPALAWPHPMSYTLDHVIPLVQIPALGECLDNVKPSHSICNLRKGKKFDNSNSKVSRRWQAPEDE